MQNNHYKYPLAVDIHDVDFNGCCRTSAILEYIQGAAQSQLNDVGLSYDELLSRGVAFIISRITLEVYKPLYAYEKIVASTYPAISRGMSFKRCYYIERDGEIIARANAQWALVDINTHRLVRVEDFDLGLETFPELELEIPRLRLPREMEQVGKYTVGYRDIDQNNHINNTRYADIYSCFLKLRRKRIKSITINYQNEARFSEGLSVYREECDGKILMRTERADGVINSECIIELCDI